jgi:hypothetical protein
MGHITNFISVGQRFAPVVAIMASTAGVDMFAPQIGTSPGQGSQAIDRREAK